MIGAIFCYRLVIVPWLIILVLQAITAFKKDFKYTSTESDNISAAIQKDDKYFETLKKGYNANEKNRQRTLDERIEIANNKINSLNAQIRNFQMQVSQEVANSKTALLSSGDTNLYTVQMLVHYLETGRADTLKEALQLNDQSRRQATAMEMQRFQSELDRQERRERQRELDERDREWKREQQRRMDALQDQLSREAEADRRQFEREMDKLRDSIHDD